MGAHAAGQSRPLIEWAVAAKTMPGEARSGDLHVVAPFPGGVLVAAIDGLGHGDEAADAAATAAEVLRARASEPLVPLVQRCHEALRATRGVAMSVASLAGANASLSWLGVGNVEGRLFRADRSAGHPRQSMLLRGGVVGFRLPLLRTAELPVGRDDTLMFATDGVDVASLDGARMDEAPAKIAEGLLARFAVDTDDALVLVARYRGEGA